MSPSFVCRHVLINLCCVAQELHARLPDRATAVRDKLNSIQGQHHQDLGLGKVAAPAGGVAWVRGAELGAGHSLFGGTNPSAADVVQGALGSCYLLSSLAVLAEAKGTGQGTSYLQDTLFLPTQGQKGETHRHGHKHRGMAGG